MVRGVAQYAAIAIFVLLGGFVLWRWGAPNAENIIEKTDPAVQKAISTKDETAIPRERLGDTARKALIYAEAVRDGRCEKVIELTWWMQERLNYLAAQGSSNGDTAEAVQEMCEALRERTPVGNQLDVQGIEDQYLFARGVIFEVVGEDGGKRDLAKPVAGRAWLRVNFPLKNQALRDHMEAPIRSLKVGVNVSTDGYILKSGVAGNLDIDWESISYDW